MGEGLGGEVRQSLIDSILEASPDGVLMVDARNTVVCHNARFLEVWGLPATRAGGSREGQDDSPLLANALARVRDPEDFLARVQALYDNPAMHDECEIPLLDGRTLERHSSGLHGPDGRYLGRVWFFRDVTQRKRQEQMLRDLAVRDPLTGLANRRCFFERAAEEHLRARRNGADLALLMLDVDHFKRINDRWGHAAGDRSLQRLGETLAGNLRATDLAARIGGEEFAVLVPGVAIEPAVSFAERLRELVHAHPPAIDGIGTIPLSVSIGVAVWRPADTDLEATLKRADAALYRAKAAGRNRVARAS